MGNYVVKNNTGFSIIEISILSENFLLLHPSHILSFQVQETKFLIPAIFFPIG
jgi:hypothetical protein